MLLGQHRSLLFAFLVYVCYRTFAAPDCIKRSARSLCSLRLARPVSAAAFAIGRAGREWAAQLISRCIARACHSACIRTTRSFFQTASSSRVLFASCPTYCHCVSGANFGGALDCREHMCAGRPRGPPASPDASVFAYAAHRKERNGIALPLLSPPLF